MPVTKTAKRALKSSKRKEVVNKAFRTRLEIAQRLAAKKPTAKHVKDAVSLIDRAVKKNLIHKNKAARIKSKLSKLVRSPKKAPKKTGKTKSSNVVPKETGPKK